MNNTQIVKVDGAQRQLAAFARSDSWTIEEAKTLLADRSPCQIIADYQRGLAPLADVDPELNGPGASAVRDWLMLIGMKIAPNMGPDSCSTWLAAMTMALSDLPAIVAAQAARNAIHIPMRYLNEVEVHVRVEADKLMEEHRTALRRLRCLQADIERAASPQQPMIEAPIENEQIPPSEIRGMCPVILRIGLKVGRLTQEEIDAATRGTN